MHPATTASLLPMLPLRPVGGLPILLRPASLASIDESVLLIDLWPGEDGSGDVAPSGSIVDSVDVFVIVGSPVGGHGYFSSDLDWSSAVVVLLRAIGEMVWC